MKHSTLRLHPQKKTKQKNKKTKKTNKKNHTNFPYKSIYHCIKPFLAYIRSFLCFHLHIRNLHILTVKLCKILLLSAILKNNLKNEGKNIFYLGIDTCSCPSLNTIIICNESERSILVWYSWPLGFVCLISGSGNGWIHVFNGGRHSVQIFPSRPRKWCTALNEGVS
jgi:hypothetical protein